MKKVTLKDIAIAAGVSEMTASRALRNKGDVANKTVERVKEAAQQLGYVPNQAASMLASRVSSIIPMILPSLNNTVFLDVIDGAQGIIHSAGYQMMLGNLNYSLEKETETVMSLMSWSPAAILVAGTEHTDSTLKVLCNAHCPVIEIMDLTDSPIDTCVGFSHFDAGREMGEYLLGKGYKRIAFIGNQLEKDKRAMKRHAGLLNAIEQSGLQDIDNVFLLSISDDYGSKAGARVLEDIVREQPQIDCIYFSNDDLAVGALMTAARLGIDVPGQVAIAGFNGLEIGQISSPRLTTSLTPRKEIGEQAAQIALDRINGSKPLYNSLDLGCTLLPGESA